jgi:hypothetical protein
MKKLLLLFVIVLLFSCEKEVCKTCTTVITFSGGYSTSVVNCHMEGSKIVCDDPVVQAPSIPGSTTTSIVCGKELQNINEVTTATLAQGYKITVRTTCK